MSTKEIAESIVRRGLPYSIFDDEAEYKSTLAWIANEIDEALTKAIADERERCVKIAEYFGTAAYAERQKNTAKAKRELIAMQDTADDIARAIRDPATNPNDGALRNVRR